MQLKISIKSYIKISLIYLTLIFSSIFIPVKAKDATKSITNFDLKLKEADQIRSSNSERFSDLLSELNNNIHLLSKEQKDYLNYLLAYQTTFKGEPGEAIKLFNKFLLTDASAQFKFRANLMMINIYAITQNWTEGLSHLSKALEVLPSIQEPEIYIYGLAVSAVFYNQLGQYDLGLNYALRLNSKAKQGRNLCMAKLLILEAKFKLNRLTEKNPEIDKGIEICERSGEAIMTSVIRTYIATLFIKEKKSLQALNFLNQHLDYTESTKYPPLQAKYYSLLTEAYWLENKIEEAEKFAQKTLQQAVNFGDTEPTVIAYEILHKIALEKENYQTALEYHLKYATADKAYLDDINAKHLAFQLAEHQAIEQETKIQLLDEQNKLLLVEQELAQAEAENNKLFISLLIALSTLLIFWAYKSRLTQKRLRQMAEYDALTGIYNRGHFTQQALSSLDYCQSSNLPLSCILFDLDKFKIINDSYGHACGDWTLKKTADVCRNIGRKNDIFVRLGGEEFCIFLPGCDLQTAKEFAELCRKEIAAIDTSESGFNFDITASFGITNAQLSGFDLDKIIADADQAMYQSKNNGRNQITLFSH